MPLSIADSEAARAVTAQGFASLVPSSLEDVDGLGEVGDADMAGEGGVLLLKLEEHLPGNPAVAEVAGGSGTELGDVLCFREIHFEESANAGGKREKIGGGLSGFRRWGGGDAR